MAKYYTNTEELELIADAIREKGGTNAQLTFPNEFVSAIENLPTGGGTVATGNDVVFYDYDGTIVASYSASAFAQLSQLPANPTHTGLVAQGWNWSLANAKTFVTAHPNDQLNIGQMYITESGNTEIDVVMQEGRLEPILTITVKGTITVDWGDETTPDTVTGTSLSTRQAVSHTYAQAGTYTISISAEENNRYGFSGSNQYTLLRKNTIEDENRTYTNTIQHIRIGSNTEIKNYAFYNCHSLMNITIPNSVTSIGSNAFLNCYSITSVTIPDTITSIGSGMLQYCYSLASITIPNGVTSIGNYAFYGCCSLTSITTPDTATNFGNYVFHSCYSLTDVTIPDDMTSIGTGMFTYCESLSSVTIPDSTTSIGNQAFQYCYSLTNIIILGRVTSIGDQAFQTCYSLSNIIIPDSVTSIGKQAFNSCRSLASITIPDSVTSIGDNAFKNCYGVAEYHILPTNPPTAGTTLFDGIVSDCIIYVPAASLEAYKTAENWSNYASYMKGE